ncbi:MAG TPA: hypothetical protein VKE40_20580 [Gemmataceae bacterium]|nr:hypothetical protein [Gemmataceae bacterium]
MTDTNDRDFVPTNDTPAIQPETPAELFPTEPATESVPAVDANGSAHEAPTWRNEAGRKGAKRIHQLIEAGKLYEREHGLTSGRQRLRQLIELGKLYEKEHGRGPIKKERKGGRLSRSERDELVATLLECLVRIAKPSFRPELNKLAEALSPEKGQAA